MSQDDETVGVTLNADTTNYVRGMDQAAQSTDKVTSSLGKADNAFSNLKNKTNRGLVIIAAGEVAAVTSLTMAAARLESQLGQLQAKSVYAGGGLQSYENAVRSLRTEMGVTTNQAINMITQLNTLGQNHTVVQQQAQDWTKMSRITGEDVTAPMVQFMRTTGGNQNNSTRYAQMVTGLSQQYGASASSIAGFGTQIAPIAQQSGMSVQQITGVSAAFAKSGQDGYAAANAFNKILTDINQAVQYGSPELARYASLLGKTNDEFSRMGRAEAVTQILEKINSQGSAGAKTFDQLGIDGVRAQKSFNAVNQQGGLRSSISSAYNDWNNGGDKFQKAYEASSTGFFDEMAKVKETLSTTGQAAGSIFLPAFTSMAKVLNGVLTPVRAITDLLGKFTSGTPQWAQTLGGGAALTAAVGLPLALRATGPVATALFGMAGFSQFTGGTAAQGLRMGLRPQAERSRGQLGVIDAMYNGQTSWLQDAIFNTTWSSGDLYGGRKRGTLDQATIDALPDRIKNSSSEMARWALQNGYGTKDDLKYLQSFKDPSNKGYVQRNGARGGGFFGWMADMGASVFNAQVEYLHPEMQNNPTASRDRVFGGRFRDDMYKFKDEAANFGQSFLDIFGRGNGGSSGSSSQLNQASENLREFNRAGRDATTTLGAVTKSFGSMMWTGAKATVGAGYGGLQLANNALRGVGGLAGGFLMANAPMLAITGGLALGGAIYDKGKSNSEISAATIDNVDNSPGSAWRNALGEASRNVTNFADSVNAAKNSIDQNTNPDMVSSTEAQGAKRLSRRDIVDKNITGNAAQDSAYIPHALLGASDQVRQGYKHDLLAAGYSTDEINQMMSKTNSDPNIYNWTQSKYDKWAVSMGLNNQDDAARNIDVGGKSSNITLGSILNDTVGYFFGGNKEKAKTAADAIGYEIGLSRKMGDVQQGRTTQAFLGEYVNREPTSLGGQNAAYSALSSGLGLTSQEEDKKKFQQNRTAMNNAVAAAKASTEYINASSADKSKVLSEQTYAWLGKNAPNSELYQKWSTAVGMTGGMWTGGIGDLRVTTPTDYWGLNSERAGLISRSTAGYGAAGLGALMTDRSSSLGKAVGQALDKPADATKTYDAMGQLASSIAQTASSSTDVNTQFEKLKGAAGDVNDAFFQLANMAQQQYNAEREFSIRMGHDSSGNAVSGDNTMVGTITRFQQNTVNPLITTIKSGTASPDASQRLNDARNQYMQYGDAVNQRMQAYNDQVRSLNYNAGQSRELMRYSEGITRENFARQQSYSDSDFNRQRKWSEEDFNRSMTRNWESFWISRSRNEESYNINRRRSEESYQISRRRSEEDYTIQVDRMAKQQAKSVYDAYNRVLTQRTWGANNLLSNLADQQKKLEEQTANLEKARKLGLNNETIDQLGLNQSSGAQQLSRLVGDMSKSPELAQQYNDAIAARVKESGKLMRDNSNTAFTNMEEDRKKSLDRMQEDFDRSMSNTEQDQQRYLKQSLDDMNRQTKYSLDDQERSMERGLETYRISRDRAAHEMEITFTQQRQSFEKQLQMQRESLDFFAQDTSRSLDENYKLVMETAGKTARDNFTSLKDALDKTRQELYDNYLKIDQIVTDMTGGQTTVSKLSYGDNPNPITGKRMSIGMGHPIGGPSEDSGANTVATYSTGTPKNSGGPSADAWIAPVAGQITAEWGRKGNWSGSKTLGKGYHSGTDFAVPVGTPVHASGDGSVIFTGWAGAYGNQVQLDHGNGIQTHYSHLSKFLTSRGSNVRGGDTIALSGNTGNSSGPHLHFEVWQNGMDQNPMNFIGQAFSGAAAMPDFANNQYVKAWEKLMASHGFVAGGRYKPGMLAERLTQIWQQYHGGSSGSYPADMSVGNPGFVYPGDTNYPKLVARWESIVHAAMKRQGMPDSMYPNMMRQLNTESSGQTGLMLNTYDVNSRNGSGGSRGPWQFIPATFSAYRDKSLANDILDPWSSTNAAVRYIMQKYPNSMYTFIGAGHGYKNGTNAAKPGYALIGEEGPELIKLNGNERIWNANQTKYAMLTARGSETVHTQAGSVTTNNYDNSFHVANMTVISNNADEMMKDIERKRRMQQLIGRAA